MRENYLREKAPWKQDVGDASPPPLRLMGLPQVETVCVPPTPEEVEESLNRAGQRSLDQWNALKKRMRWEKTRRYKAWLTIRRAWYAALAHLRGEPVYRH